MQWVGRDRLRMGLNAPGPLRYGRSTQQRSVPLALASLVLGSRRSETGLCEIGSGELVEVRRGHETRATRADGDY
jgi:hypothetical protein